MSSIETRSIGRPPTASRPIDQALANVERAQVKPWLHGGKLDEPARYESYAAILTRAQRDEVTVEASAAPPLELLHWSMHSYGAMFCEVGVNAITDEPRINRFLGAFDCGRIQTQKPPTPCRSPGRRRVDLHPSGHVRCVERTSFEMQSAATLRTKPGPQSSEQCARRGG